jgi:hypothetical protein
MIYTKNKKTTICFFKSLFLLTVFLCFLQLVLAGTPDLKTPSPVIYLADNLDEEEKLGYCLDTQGRGFSDRMHAHSCKPRGGDVQFIYLRESMQISSAIFEGKCVVVLGEASAGSKFGLVNCSSNDKLQKFYYDTATLEFRVSKNKNLCVSVGKESRRAGPFMARDLQLSICGYTEPKYKQWLVLTK